MSRMTVAGDPLGTDNMVVFQRAHYNSLAKAGEIVHHGQCS